MAKNTKTPVMILQEFAVKKNTVPEYELVYSQQGTHENIFHYQVTILHERALGVGRSKKEAKHEAANKALKLLGEKGVFESEATSEYSTEHDMCQENVQPTKAPVNCIPTLLDICVDNKIPIAEFFEISVVGPPHCREFTYECRVASITTRAIAGSKKNAKQLAAKEMLSRIISVMPEIQKRSESDQLKLTEKDEEVYEKYANLSKFSSTKTNFNSKVTEYDLQFKQLVKDKSLEPESVMMLLEKPWDEELLKKLLDVFELEYQILTMQEKPPIVVVAVNSDTPVTVMDMGRTIEEASKNAINQMFMVLETLVSVNLYGISSSSNNLNEPPIKRKRS